MRTKSYTTRRISLKEAKKRIENGAKTWINMCICRKWCGCRVFQGSLFCVSLVSVVSLSKKTANTLYIGIVSVWQSINRNFQHFKLEMLKHKKHRDKKTVFCFVLSSLIRTFAPAKSILVGAKHFWRGARVVEEARLESVEPAKPVRRFESCSLRRNKNRFKAPR